MTTSEVQDLLSQWFLDDCKVFKVRYDFADPDTIVIQKKKEDLYVVDCSKSTTDKFKEYTKEQLQKNINNGTLVYVPGSSTIINYSSYRTGGCTCGAWATTEPNCHSSWCSKGEINEY